MMLSTCERNISLEPVVVLENICSSRFFSDAQDASNGINVYFYYENSQPGMGIRVHGNLWNFRSG